MALWKRRKQPYELSKDRDLVERMLAGEREAFDRFCEDYFSGLYRFALSRLRNDEQLAQEIVQSTVCIALEKLDSYRGEASLFSWLCSICRFEISAHVRRRQRRPEPVEWLEDHPEIRGILDAMAVVPDGPEGELRRKQLAHLVHLTLDHLPAKYGRALEWKYFDGLAVKEIAERLGVGPKAAESTLTRAREAFRSGFESLAQGLDGQGYRGLRFKAAGRNA